jgi:hypothetical protein
VTERLVAGCLDCERDLEHCHGTWIEHRRGAGECTVSLCEVEVEGHAVVVDCVEIHGDCS